MNFVLGSCVCRNFPDEEVALRMSRPKSWPEEPREWRRMRVWVWLRMGGMVKGGVKGAMVSLETEPLYSQPLGWAKVVFKAS